VSRRRVVFFFGWFGLQDTKIPNRGWGNSPVAGHSPVTVTSKAVTFAKRRDANAKRREEKGGGSAAVPTATIPVSPQASIDHSVFSVCVA
jgi:hypothetical protein